MRRLPSKGGFVLQVLTLVRCLHYLLSASRSAVPVVFFFLPCHHKIIVAAHPSRGFHDLSFVVCDHFDPLEGHAQVEAEFCHVGRIRIHSLRESASLRAPPDISEFEPCLPALRPR